MTETPTPAPDMGPPVLKSPTRLYLILLLISVLLIGLGYLLGGLDMAKGALLGCLIVGVNLMGTVSFVRLVIRDRRYKGLLIASFIAKFGLTMVVLYLAIVRYGWSAIGLMLGLSSMLLASLAYAATQRQAREGA